jgi:hypothetical protein
VIDYDEAVKRIKNTEENYYILNVDNRVCLDAKDMGNLARFINHRFLFLS